MTSRRFGSDASVWFGDIDSLSLRDYCVRVCLVGLTAWLYWESLNSFVFDWWSIDGYPTYIAARLWLSGNTDAIYQLGLWVSEGAHPEWRRMLVVHGIPNAGTSFVYHPTYLLLMLPVAWAFSFEEFVYFQLVINSLAIGVVAMESLRLAGPADEDRRRLAVLLAVLSFPGLYSVYLGQNILLVLALILLSWRLLQGRRYLLAGFLAAIAIAMKAWVAPVIVLVLFMHGLRASLLGFSVLFLVLLAVPLLFAQELLKPYVEVVSRLTSITVFPYNNVAVRAALARLANPEWVADVYHWAPRTVSFGVRVAETLFVFSTIATAGVLWRLRRPEPVAVFVAALSLLMLLPSVCWTHYLVFVIPAGFWLFLRAGGRSVVPGFVVLALLAVPWHPFSGSILPRAHFRVFVEQSPVLLAWCLILPMLLIALAGFFVLLTARKNPL